MLKDSAPRGEELPGDGDWKTDSKAKHSEKCTGKDGVNRLALGTWGERRKLHMTEEHFSSEKTSWNGAANGT